MASKRRRNFRRICRLSRRTQIVWTSFLGAMTLVIGLLAMGDGTARSGFPAASPTVLDEALPHDPARDPIFQIAAPLAEDRWTGIVVHHSGGPAGDAETLHRRHVSYGYEGLGYHFLIGNGNGLDDGVIHIGYRWNGQKPGAHSVLERYNQHAVGICLIGNGDRRPFTDRQILQLTNLVQRLQRGLGIPAGQVHLHRDLVDGIGSPGRYFPAAEFEAQLLD